MLEIGQKWGKIANYPPNAQQRSAPLRDYHCFQPKKKGCPSAEDRTFSRTCRLQGQGLELRGQGQGLQNISSRTEALLRMVAPGAGLCGVTLCDVTTFMKIMSKST